MDQFALQENPHITIQVNKESDQSISAALNIESNQQAILGTAFHFKYDPDILLYQSYDKGNFFEQNNGEPIYLVKDINGEIYVGISLRRDQQMATNDGNLIKLHFQPLHAGKTEFNFKNELLSTLENGQRKNIQAEWQSQKFGVNNVFQPQNDFLLLISICVLFVLCLTIAAVYILVKKRKNRKNLENLI